MMKKYLVLLLLASAGSANAAPVSFNFTQDGYDEGATISGTFAGEDLDNDGQLTSFNGELTNFTMSFSGNSLVSAFTLGFADLWGFVYDLPSGPLGDGLTGAIEGIGAGNSMFDYVAGPGPFAECGIGFDCASVTDFATGAASFSNQFVMVSAVPVPAAVWLFGSGLLGLVGVARRSAKTA